jgi:hypothetical protein
MAPYFRKHNTKTNTNTARGFNGRSNGYNNITGQWSPLPAVSVGRDNVSGNSEGNGDDGGSGGGSIAETRLKRFDDTKPIAVRYQNVSLIFIFLMALMVWGLQLFLILVNCNQL